MIKDRLLNQSETPPPEVKDGFNLFPNKESKPGFKTLDNKTQKAEINSSPMKVRRNSQSFHDGDE